jgi:GDPmannose 4,6-dehydratase
MQQCLTLGNLSAVRDWGYAKDYVEAQWLMLQQESPEDFVIATGVQHSIREFVNCAAEIIGMPLQWQGSGLDEKALNKNGDCIIRVDPSHFRPTEVDSLVGDSTKARQKLGWQPKVDFSSLVEEMVLSDLRLAIIEQEMQKFKMGQGSSDVNLA